MSAYVCVACADTGRNSRGGPCGPCAKKGRQPLRDAIQAGLLAIFAEHEAAGTRPSLSEAQAFLKWAFEPRVTYAAGYKDRGSDEVGMFAGPNPHPEEIFKMEPVQDRPAYIIELTRPMRWGDEVRHRPIARWRNGEWQRKTKRP